MEAIDPQVRWLIIHDASRGIPPSDTAGERKIPRVVVNHVLEQWRISGHVMTCDEATPLKSAAIRLVKLGFRPRSVWMNYFYSVSLAELLAAAK